MSDVIEPTPAYLPAPAPRERAAPRAPVDPLWRSVLGMFLRRHRLAQGLTLAQVARTSGVSTQYLSEIERGVKDPSSEIIAAVVGALGLNLLDLTAGTTGVLRDASPAAWVVPGGPVCLAGPVALAV
ncbi:helix-turn-helix domain-containing protein [Kocuria sp. SM24M-10]|uniref:helix-turn-helix domain-containing protein n=1 Tax=Kocuria sp. SM24M-10 TaxID=1660349 RepID=UPI000649682E|nr:DNA-binding protein [Kocuria sp. SM24M-10]